MNYSEEFDINLEKLWPESLTRQGGNYPRPADKTQNVFDLGYTDYEKFDQYSEDDTRFITRLKSNAQKEVVKELPVDPEGDIDKEQIVYLGTKSINRMKHCLQLVETKV